MIQYELILLISGLALAAISVYLFCMSILSTQSDKVALALASGDEDESKDKIPPIVKFSIILVHSLTLRHALKIKSEKYRNKIKAKIVHAGFTKNLNVDEFIGLQILWGFVLPIFLFLFNFALQLNYPFYIFILIALGGMYFPYLFCQSCSTKRASAIDKDLPFFIDLMALSTEAGMDFIGSIQKITEKANKDNILAEEFYTLLKELKLGASKKEAFENLSKRVSSAEIKSLVTMIQDSAETGASIAKTLKAKAEQMRYERFNKAEQLGAKASQKILIPMMIFIMPAVLITVFAPIALQFYYGGQ